MLEHTKEAVEKEEGGTQTSAPQDGTPAPPQDVEDVQVAIELEHFEVLVETADLVAHWR